MANSEYEYVKSFEVERFVVFDNLIVVRLEGCNSRRFSELHEFETPNDRKALSLMNSCAGAVLEEYPDITFAYGFSSEYSFVFKKDTRFYKRRFSKILSVIVSFFTSVYVMRWKEFFPQKELILLPLFCSRVFAFGSVEFLQAYLAWRQYDCHVKYGKAESEAQEILKDTQNQERNELFFQQFGINYNPDIFCQGSFVLKEQVEVVVKYDNNGNPVKRLRKKVKIGHLENITARSFWNNYSMLLKDLGYIKRAVNDIEPEYVKSFQVEERLMPCNWIVVRIDGCHFRSFVLKKDSQFYERNVSQIVSFIVSFFSAKYVMKWKDVFSEKELKYPPRFDGRAVCYPSSTILCDYLAWRQVDCHINNQYNTCFWMLVKSGKSKSDAQNCLKGTQSREKNELLYQQFGIDYNMLPIMFRQGSSAFWKKEYASTTTDGGLVHFRRKVVVEHCSIIKPSF